MDDSRDTTSKLSVSDSFQCPICLEEIRSPKYLPCFHTFCKLCIETYISSTATCKDDSRVRAIECPICRKRIEAPRKDISNEEWSSALPQNKLVASMCTMSRNRGENDLCKFCQRNDKTVPSRHWCKVCMETICDGCKDLHKLVPSLQNHKILNITDNEEWRNGVEVEEFCTEHGEKVIDAFCYSYNHESLCCSICLVKHHRLCPNVESLEDIAVEKVEGDVTNVVSSLIEMEKTLGNMQLNNQAKISHLKTKKEEICINTEKKIEEIKKKLDDAHEEWVKRFEQTHLDSVGNIEIVSDELKRFSTTVCETRILLQSLLANGSPKQLFITKHKQFGQIVDHISRMKSLDIWNLPEDYSLSNMDFLGQLLNENKFKDVNLSKLPSGLIETILQMTPVAMTDGNFIRRRRNMSEKDWMKVTFSKTSEAKLPEGVYYGLFVHDAKIVLPLKNPPSLKVYDVSTANGKCVHTEHCQNTPYGLCHARGAKNLQEVYVSFYDFVVLYRIDVEEVFRFWKLQIIQLKEPMKAISCGPTAIFSASDNKAFICSHDFTIKHTMKFSLGRALIPFVSSSMTSDLHCFYSGSRVKVIDSINKTMFCSESFGGQLRGLTFDLNDNVLICTKNNKFKQVRQGGKENRDIELVGINESYNVVLHPLGEKMIVFDFGSKEQFCIYEIS